MKPVCFIFFSWSVWLKAPACTQPRAVMKTECIPNHSDPRDDMESQVKHHPAQAKQHHLGPGLEPRPWRWAGCGALSCRSTGKPAIPNHSLQNYPLSCLLEFYHHPNPVTEGEQSPLCGQDLHLGSSFLPPLPPPPQVLSSCSFPGLSSLLLCPATVLPADYLNPS